MRQSILLSSVAILLVSQTAHADGSVVEKQLGTTSAPFGYLEYLPPGYDTSPNEHYPIVVALSGISELGNGTTQLKNVGVNGPIKRIKDGSTYFADKKVIVIAPQAPDQWMFDAQLASMKQFFPYLLTTYRVDTKRVYFTGLSSGGGGVYTFIGSGFGKDLITAAIAICGNQDPYASFIPSWKDMPLWSFQNWGDPTNTRNRPIGWTSKIAQAQSGNASLDVLSGYPNEGGDTSKAAVDTQTATFDGTSFAWASGVPAGGTSELRLTLYPAASHDAWTATYENPVVWDWLLAHGAPVEVPDAGAPDGAGGGTGTGSASTSSGTSSTSTGGTNTTSSTSTGGGTGGAGGTGGTSNSGGGSSGESSGCTVAAPGASDGWWTAPLLALGLAFTRRRGRPAAARRA
ncbi:Hypothetical protein A7982_02130 [Minicystis rosea]|nr:Hypothetical protein A7982_02130 [Minicystis rosea]